VARREHLLLIRRFAMGLAMSLAIGNSAGAQSKFPTKAVEIVLPYAAGASNDLAARAIAQYLETRWSVPVRVLNKTGGNTVPAASDVMQSAPDGHTVYIDGLAQSSMLEVVVKSLPFSVLDRTYLGTVGQVPLMIMVPGTSPHKTLSELAAAWKANPGSLSWTSVGGTSTIDMTMRRFARAVGVNIAQTRPVNTKGGAEATVLVAGGHVDFGVGSWSTVGSHHASGRIRPLAIAAPERLDPLPDVPTTAQAGLKDVEVFNWIGFSGPANIPPHVVAAWESALKDVVTDPGALKKFEQIGVTKFVNDSKATREMVIRDKKIVEQLWPEFTR
jgi:tripartite-type tricarboxylate transporter receptor subunit TctC